MCFRIIRMTFKLFLSQTNLKKQGVLALTFAQPADYDRITGADRVCVDLSCYCITGADRVCVNLSCY